MSETPPPDQPAKPRRTRKRRHVGHGLAWFLNVALAVVTVSVLILGAAALYFKNNPLSAPYWVRDMIEARLAEVIPQARVSFADMALVIDEGWRPRLRLRDVAVASAQGQEIVRFNEVQAVFAAAPILDGKVRPREIALSGIVARLRRAQDGSFAVQTGSSDVAPARQAATLPQLIGQLDMLLEAPALSRLQTVDVRALTLRYEDVRSERAWTVDGGRLRLSRNGDALALSADLAVLSGGSGVATLAANYSSEIGQTAATFGVSFDEVAAGDIAAQGAAFAWLGVLQAPISGSVRSGLQSDGRFVPIAATLQIGAGVVQPNAGTTPIPFDGARSYFSYDPDEKLLSFDELSVRSKWITAGATGTAALGIDPGSGQLSDLVGQISLTDIAANPSALYDAPVNIAQVDADFRLKLDPFRVELGQALIKDQTRRLLVQGDVAADPEGWRLALDGRMDAIAPERLMTLWPERAVPSTRSWLDKNLHAGEIRNIDVALRRAPQTPPQTYLAFDYDKATVKFAKNLPPVTEGRGHFSLAENRLVIAMDAGNVIPPQGGPIAMTGSSFIIPDVTAKGETGTPSVVRLETRSSIVSALSLLNMPPLSVMDKAKLPVALAEGQAALSGTLALSLKPGVPPKVQFHAEGDLLAVQSEVLVKNRDVRAAKLRVAVDNTNLSLRGQGRIDDVPFDAVFAQPIGRDAGPSRLTGDVTLSDAALKTFGVNLPAGSVSGSGTGEIDITLPKGAPPRFALASDLRGLRVSVPQVSWSKSPNQTGRLRVAGVLGAVPQIDTLDVSGPGLAAAGSVKLNSNGTLDRVRFDTVEVGNWLNIPLDLVGRGAGRPLQVALRGGTLDLRRAAFGPSTGGQAGPPMDVALDRLQITDTIALTNLRGRFGTAGGLDGSFAAQLNGAAAVEGRVIPQDGRSAVRLISQNAGNVLRAAGLLKQVRGGDLSLVLLPVGKGGAFDGRLEIGGATIQDAPGIAALLNAVSVVGLVNELNGDGIYFDDVEASFRLTPNRLTLTEASAVGASMGLSMDGTYALDTGQLGMQGVISPVYLLNGIGSLFTRKGEGLIGFNYTLTGPAKEPKVAVNPLSALTPAMFREIFRAPPPELPVVDGVSESTLPDPTPTPAPQRPVDRRFEGR
ncbi:MAG: DUF3971 domain-containing protein [Sulfitobacter sp.]